MAVYAFILLFKDFRDFCYNGFLWEKNKTFLNEPNLLSLHFDDMHLAVGCFVLPTYLHPCPDAALASQARTTSFRYH